MMGSDMQDSYRRDGRDSGSRRSGGPSARRGDWGDERASGPRARESRDAMMRGGDTPSRRPGSGPTSRPPSSGGSGGIGSGGSGGRVRRTLAGSPGDDERRSGSSRSAGRPGGGDYASGPSSRAGRGSDALSRSGSRGASGRYGAPQDDGSGSGSGRRSMAQRVRDVGRNMSEQLSAMMDSVSRAGRSAGRDRMSMSRSMPVTGVMPGMSLGDLPIAPYRRSRSRVLLRKWRARRSHSNGAAIAIGFFVVILVLSGMFGAGGAGAVYAVSYYQAQRGAIANAYAIGSAHSTRILDRNGNVLYAMQRKEGYQFNVPYKYINPEVVTATVDTEDRTFWTNYGVDFYGTARALITDLAHGGQSDQGGSTITQQLVKLLVLQNGEKTFDRKLHEMILALGMTKGNHLDPNGFDKWQIMQMYLNNIYYDDQNTGIEAAARNYFGYQEKKDANNNIIQEANQQLTLAQIALLVRIPNYPTYYYPLDWSCDSAPCPVSKWTDAQGNAVGNETHMMQGAKKVLDDMAAVGDLTPAKETETLKQVTDILVNQQIYHWKGLSEGTVNTQVTNKKAPHFVDYVIDELINQFGMNDPTTLAQAGLTIYTTLDYNLEAFMETDAAKYVYGDPKDPNHNFTRYWYCQPYYHNSCANPPLNTATADNVNNMAGVAIDPHTGDILAMMGSVNYASTDPKVLGFNNMAVLPRSMGSSTKPLVYATAFQMGWYPGIMLQDIPVCFPGKQDPPPDGKYPIDPAAPACQGYYVAHDYDATSFSGTAPIREQLANSLNIPATEAQFFVGANYNVASRFLSMIGRMGITTCQDCNVSGIVSATRLGPTTALGTQEIPLVQLTGAYGVFADGGKHVPTRAILRIDDTSGNTIYTAPTPHPEQAMSPQVAYMMTSILTDNQARAGDFKIENPLCFTCYPDFLDFGPNNNQQYIAAKTGTSQGDNGPKDVITMGYSPYMALGVWAGNSDPHDDLGSNIIGITGAGYVFHDVMAWAIKNYKWTPRPFPIPAGLTRAQFNCTTGLAPYKGTDMKTFADLNDSSGPGWCPLLGYRPGSTDLYVGWNTGGKLYDIDWIEDGQFPDVS